MIGTVSKVGNIFALLFFLCLYSHDSFINISFFFLIHLFNLFHVELWLSYLEDLKSCNVEDSDEGGPRAFAPVQGLVDPGDDPLEELLVDGLGEGLTGKLNLDKIWKQSC